MTTKSDHVGRGEETRDENGRKDERGERHAKKPAGHHGAKGHDAEVESDLGDQGVKGTGSAG